MYILVMRCFFFFLTFVLISCSGTRSIKIDYEKYTLANGLDVILHVDRSDPIVAASVVYNVGSNREKKGKSGFAHLFEHMLFQQSEHVGEDQFFKIVEGLGGNMNGGTWSDGTYYYEQVPKNALETILWAESDRMGFFLKTLSKTSLANQKEVVLNEKRQRYENTPYGYTHYVISKYMFPLGHPYRNPTIGLTYDIKSAEVEDVRSFYMDWYGVNNATLVVAGDIDVKQTKQWIQKYFGEIEHNSQDQPLIPQPATLTETRSVFFQDKLISVPLFNLVFPTVEAKHNDYYPLVFLGQLLAERKDSPLYRVIVEKAKLAAGVSAYNFSRQIAGSFYFRIKPYPGIDLDVVKTSLFEALELFETEGVSKENLEIIKTKYKTQFFSGWDSVLTKANELGLYNEFYGSPDYHEYELKLIEAVSAADVLRVFNTYIKDRPGLFLSVVPKGKIELGLEGAIEDDLVELEDDIPSKSGQVDYAFQNSSFDRSKQPEVGPQPLLKSYSMWDHSFHSNFSLKGMEYTELPLVRFQLIIPGGQLLEDLNKRGIAQFVTKLMLQGTNDKSPIEFEKALDKLGASLSFYTASESFILKGSCLVENFTQLMDLVEDVLLEPRWDEAEFNRLKTATLSGILQRQKSPDAVANLVFQRLLYGKDHVYGGSSLGTAKSVSSISLADLTLFYNQFLKSGQIQMNVVGNLSKSEVIRSVKKLAVKWPDIKVGLPAYKAPKKVAKTQLFIVDFPGTSQSIIRAGYLALPFTHPDFVPVKVANVMMGSFQGALNQILREEKGYTYGAYSRFSGGIQPGPFTVSTKVETSTAAESIGIIKKQLSLYAENVKTEDFQYAKAFFGRSYPLKYESLGALLTMVSRASKYGLDANYILNEQKNVNNLSLKRYKSLIEEYIDLDNRKMVFLVVGDLNKMSLPMLRKLGFGEPVLLDKKGELL